MDSGDTIIEQLRELVAKQAAQLEQQAARTKQPELALAKAKQDSSTSSKPPRAILPSPTPSGKGPGDERNHDVALSPDISDNYASRCRPNALTKPSNTKSMTAKYHDWG